MIKVDDCCLKTNCIDEILYNADDLKFIFYAEQKNYLKYKEGNFECSSDDEKLKFSILKLLEEMGFSINRLGTFFYKDVIFKLLKRINLLEQEGYKVLGNLLESDRVVDNNFMIEEVLEQVKIIFLEELRNPYSQFYFDLARNDNSVGTKTFHAYIQNSFDKLDRYKEKYSLLEILANDNGKKLNYGELAFEIVCYIKNNNLNEKNGELGHKKVLKQ